MEKSEDSSVMLPVKVVPGSSRDCIAGWLGNTLKVRVSAPPERGKANEAVEKLLAKELGLSNKSVAVLSGKRSALKIVNIAGLQVADVNKLLGK